MSDKIFGIPVGGAEAPAEEVVEEVVEETIKFEDTEAGKLAVEAIRKAKEGKVVKLTQKTAEFEDGTIVRFNGRATHREYKAKM